MKVTAWLNLHKRLIDLIQLEKIILLEKWLSDDLCWRERRKWGNKKFKLWIFSIVAASAQCLNNLQTYDCRGEQRHFLLCKFHLLERFSPLSLWLMRNSLSSWEKFQYWLIVLHFQPYLQKIIVMEREFRNRDKTGGRSCFDINQNRSNSLFCCSQKPTNLSNFFILQKTDLGKAEKIVVFIVITFSDLLLNLHSIIYLNGHILLGRNW